MSELQSFFVLSFLLLLSGCKDDSWDRLLKADEIEYDYTIKETDSEVEITAYIRSLNPKHEAMVTSRLVLDLDASQNLEDIKISDHWETRFPLTDFLTRPTWLLFSEAGPVWEHNFSPSEGTLLRYKLIIHKSKKDFKLKLATWRIILTNYRNNDHTNNDYAVKKINYLITSPNESQ